MNDSVDVLYPVRSCYYLGHYDMAIEAIGTLPKRNLSSEVVQQRDQLHILSLIGLGLYPDAVLMAKNGEPALRVFAQFCNGDVSFDESVKELASMGDGDIHDKKLTKYVLASLYITPESNDKMKALQHLTSDFNGLEHMSLKVKAYLSIDRADLAMNEVSKMTRKDEDSPLTILSQALVSVATSQTQVGGGGGGEDMLKDSKYNINMLCEQYGPSPLLLNCRASCSMALGRYEDAVSDLKEAVSLSKSSSPGNEHGLPTLESTYCNLCAALAHTNQSESIELLKVVTDTYPNSDFVKNMQVVTGAFDRTNNMFSNS